MCLVIRLRLEAFVTILARKRSSVGPFMLLVARPAGKALITMRALVRFNSRVDTLMFLALQ